MHRESKILPAQLPACPCCPLASQAWRPARDIRDPPSNSSPLSWSHSAAFYKPPSSMKLCVLKGSGKASCDRQLERLVGGSRTQHSIQQSLKESLVNHLLAFISQGDLQQVAASRSSIGTFWPRTGGSLERSNPEAGGHGSRGHKVRTRHCDR